MPRFSDMLDRHAEDIKQPPLLPAGMYTVIVKAYPDIDEHNSKSGKHFDRVSYKLTVAAPYEVDEEALEEFGKVAGVTIPYAFYFDTDPENERGFEITMNQHKAFLEACGVFEEGMTMQEGMTAAPGANCIVEIGHRPDENDSERFFLEIQRVFSDDG